MPTAAQLPMCSHCSVHLSCVPLHLPSVSLVRTSRSFGPSFTSSLPCPPHRPPPPYCAFSSARISRQGAWTAESIFLCGCAALLFGAILHPTARNAMLMQPTAHTIAIPSDPSMLLECERKRRFNDGVTCVLCCTATSFFSGLPGRRLGRMACAARLSVVLTRVPEGSVPVNPGARPHR